MSDFIRPNVTVEEVSENVARVIAEPLEHGYGDTLGNSLRRVLLSSLEGAAVEAIQIDGVQHEFTTVEGVYEDVTDIVLNVKGLAFKSLGVGDEATATISIDGPATVTGGDFDIPSEFNLVNPEHVICTLAEGAHLTMSMRIGTGRGYVSGEDNEHDDDPIGLIHVDSLFSPVRRCAKAVEPCRVGQHTDYDKLVLEVETNGGVSPREAVVEAANIINQHMTAFMSLADEGEQAEEMMSGVEGIVVLDKTPFYAEMGGQVADHGVITCGDAKFEVADVQKNKGGKYMHTGKVVSGSFKLGDTVTASIDVERRKSVRRAHTATHLLDAALKHVLGDHVHQAGSLVEPDRLRFDFTHFEGITPEQLAAVDAFVNDAVLEGIPVVTEVLPIEEAKKKGAVAMFGEKYGDVVRVVEMGDVSMEFCGGTHLDNTAKVGLFRIKSEGSVASGVRRIEAITGKQTLAEIRRNQERIVRVAQMLKTTQAELESKLEAQIGELKDIKAKLEKFKEEASLGEARSFLTAAKTVGSLKVITAQRDGMDPNAMRKLGDFLRDKEPGVVGVLASVHDGKVTLLAVCGKDAVAKGVKAGDIIKAIAPICGGKGGGKPDSAMGGGTEVSKVDDALAAVDDLVLKVVG